MTRFPLLLVAFLATVFGLTSSAQAAPRVNDRAEFFTKAAIDKATQTMQEISRRYKVDVVVETVPDIPADQKAKLKSDADADRNRFFRDWAVRRAEDEGVKGIYILICRNPAYLVVEPDERTRAKGFTRSDRTLLVENMLDRFRKKQYDLALTGAVDSIARTLQTSGAAVQKAPNRAPAGNPRQPVNIAGGGIAGWICLAIAALLVFWMISGLIRAFRGGNSGGYGGGPGGMPGGGYGPGGYGPGYGGGGGGGFMSSLLGGMFGAAAGNWMYDSFFRGGSHGSSWGDSSQAGYDPSAGANDQTGAGVFGPDDDPGGAGGFGGDSSTNGGFDAGSDNGGGDFGGGDYGGGGDFGGGDYGGGGDFGGGDSSWS